MYGIHRSNSLIPKRHSHKTTKSQKYEDAKKDAIVVYGLTEYKVHNLNDKKVNC